MKIQVFLSVALLWVGVLFAFSNKENVNIQQESPAESKREDAVASRTVSARVPVTGWTFSSIDTHVFSGINGDDFYVLGIKNNSRNSSVTVEVYELDAGGSQINAYSVNVAPNEFISEVHWTNNNVYAVRVTTLTAGVTGYINLGSGNR